MASIENKKKGQYYSTTEVATLLNLTQRSIYRYIDAGKLRAIKFGSWRISEEDLQEFINSRETNRDK